MTTSFIHILIRTLMLLAPLSPAAALAEPVIEYQYRVIKQYPHSSGSFTQGLEIYQGQLLESAGQYGQSSLSLRPLASSQPLRAQPLSPQFFAEGISQLDGRIYQLTWKSGKVFVYDADSFKTLSTFTIDGEGWGLANNGKQLIMSDGSSQLHFIDPQNFNRLRSLTVRHQGQPVKYLNELEWVEGKIYANIWQSDWIIIIDPQSGQVIGKVNLRALRQPGSNVLNGIAYDQASQRLYVTGKYWPQLYQIELFIP